MRSMKRKILYVVLAVSVLGFFAYRMRIALIETLENMTKSDLPIAQKASEVIVKPASSSLQASVLQASILQAPILQAPILQATSINLDVPFSPQAPFANWALPYQEACEEASVLLADRFYKGQNLSREEADKEMLAIIEWEKKNFGYYEHTTSEQTAEILRRYFGYKKVKVEYDITIDDIKRELSEGRPVIIPFAGRLLGNPYFRQPGPIYHMLVVKGYTEDGKFITNDVGTKRGKDFLYDPDVLFNAIHDAPESGSAWNDPAPEKYILAGRKAMVVVYPK